jgi:colicin import membrane protein
MAGPHKNGANGSMSEQKESSVLFSLKELMSLEEGRIKEEEDAKRKKAESEAQARLEAERRAREEEERKLRDEEERRRQDELRRKMEEAQIEAAKHAEIKKRELEEQHRLQMEAVAQQQAHERQIQQIQASKPKGAHWGLLAGVGVALLGAIIAIVFFVVIKPANDAKAAVATAKTKSESIARSDWDEGLKFIAIAKDKDPANKDIATVEDSLRKKIKEDDDAKAAEVARLAAEKKKADEQIADLTDKLSKATDPKEIEKLKAELDGLKGGKPKPVYTGGSAGGAAPPPTKKCPPGVPLCN